MATPETAAVRIAVIGPPSRIAVGSPVAGVVEDDDRVDRGQAAGVVGGEPGDPLHPDQVVARRPGRRRAGRPAWHGRTSPAGRGWTPIFGGSSASATSAVSVRSASARRSSRSGIAAMHVGRGQVAQRRPIGARSWPRVYARDDGLRCARAPHRRRAEPRQPQAGTRRDRPVRRAGHDREGPPPSRRLPPDRRQRAPPRRHLGDEAARARRGRAAGRRAADARPVHHPRRPAARDGGRGRPGQGARGRRGGGLRRPGRLARGRGHRRRRARARRDLGPAQGRRARSSRVERPGPRRRGHRRAGRGAPPRSAAASRGIAPAVARGRCGRSSSASATASSATCRWSWAWPARRRATRASSCSPASPGCWPGRSAWPPASTSRCRASASCSSARSRSSGPRWRRCPRRRRPSWPPSTGPRASRRDEAARIAHRIFAGPGDGARHARPRGARARSGRARLAVGRRGRLVRRVRDRRRHPGHPVPVRWRDRPSLAASLGLSLVALFGVGAAVSLLTGRGAAVLRVPPARDRPGRGAGDVRHRLDHRRRRRPDT